MYLAKVIGTVVSTNRNEQLTGMKLLMIKRLDQKLNGVDEEVEVAVDAIGAGVGEMVIVCRGGSARVAFGERQIPIDATIIEIVDIVEVKDG